MFLAFEDDKQNRQFVCTMLLSYLNNTWRIRFFFDQSTKYNYQNTLKINILVSDLFFFSCLDRDIHIGSTVGNGSDGCGSNEKLNTNGTNSSNSSASGKKKKCKRRHR